MEWSDAMKSVTEKINSLVFGLVLCGILSSCMKPTLSESDQNNAFHLMPPPSNCFKQYAGDRLHPAAYYTCDRNQISCCCFMPDKTTLHSTDQRSKH